MTTPMVSDEKNQQWLEDALVAQGIQRDKARTAIKAHAADVETRLAERKEKHRE